MNQQSRSLKFALDAQHEIATRGFAWIPRQSWSIPGELTSDLEDLRAEWEHLEMDRYLADNAQFRLRRYGRCYWSPAEDVLLPLPPEPYFQSEEENTYAGGVSREFAPVRSQSLSNPVVRGLVRACFECLPIPEERRHEIWEVRMHQMRIVAKPDTPGLPTPEGIHQDGTDFQTLHLLRRDNIEGGETTIYSLDREPLFRCTMRDVLDTLILEDPRIMHGVTPVVAADGKAPGNRDIFGIDYHYRPNLRRPSEQPAAR
jgi:hypothetical protein